MSAAGIFSQVQAIGTYFEFVDWMGMTEVEGMRRLEATVSGDKVRTVQNGCVVYYRRGGRNARS